LGFQDQKGVATFSENPLKVVFQRKP
jgi:hypothetical protein